MDYFIVCAIAGLIVIHVSHKNTAVMTIALPIVFGFLTLSTFFGDLKTAPEGVQLTFQGLAIISWMMLILNVLLKWMLILNVLLKWLNGRKDQS